MEGYDGDQWICDTERKFLNLMSAMQKDWQEHKYIRAQYKVGKQRTSKQNNSLHKFLKWLSKALNDRGLDMRKVLKPEVEIPWDEDGMMAKKHLWKPLQEVMLGKESTKDAFRDEYPKVYDVLNRHMIEKFDVSVPWPQRENNQEAQKAKRRTT